MVRWYKKALNFRLFSAFLAMKFISYLAGLSICAASVAALPSLNLPDFDPLTEYAKLLKMCKEDPNPNTVRPVKLDFNSFANRSNI
jgi:hypothetical protein